MSAANPLISITPAMRRKLEKEGLFEEEAKSDGASDFDDDSTPEILRKSGSPGRGRRGRGRR